MFKVLSTKFEARLWPSIQDEMDRIFRTDNFNVSHRKRLQKQQRTKQRGLREMFSDPHRPHSGRSIPPMTLPVRTPRS